MLQSTITPLCPHSISIGAGRASSRADDAELLLLAHGALGNTCWVTGEFGPARTHWEQLRALYVPERHHAAASLYGGFDHGVACRHGLEILYWLTGDVHRAIGIGEEAIALATRLSHTSSMALPMIFAAMVHQHRGEPERARQRVDAAIALATEQEFAPWVVWATALRGWALAALGETDEGTALLRDSMAAWKASGAAVLQPYFLALLAETSLNGGRHRDARAAVDDALATVRRTREGYMEAKLCRLKNELQTGSDAESSFQRSIDVARRQGARSFELRAAMSLCRLPQSRRKQAAARGRLAEIYQSFTEGFQTRDLADAAKLIEQ